MQRKKLKKLKNQRHPYFPHFCWMVWGAGKFFVKTARVYRVKHGIVSLSVSDLLADDLTQAIADDDEL